MKRAIRLVVSVDHHKKKTISIDLAYGLYLQFVTSAQFVAILPEDLQQKYHILQRNFEAENKFYSDEYRKDYERHPFIRLLNGPDVHKFFAKVLSLNYQRYKDLLHIPAGSFLEYFVDFDLFWNERFVSNIKAGDDEQTRATLFCQACVFGQFERVNEKMNLKSKLNRFAKQELAARDEEISRLNQELNDVCSEKEKLVGEIQELEARLRHVEEANMVFVPGDPYHMLGLRSGDEKAVDDRAKTLMKALHPDKSGSNETAYLFDLVLKSRELIKSSN